MRYPNPELQQFERSAPWRALELIASHEGVTDGVPKLPCLGRRRGRSESGIVPNLVHVGLQAHLAFIGASQKRDDAEIGRRGPNLSRRNMSLPTTSGVLPPADFQIVHAVFSKIASENWLPLRTNDASNLPSSSLMRIGKATITQPRWLNTARQ
jgi:hypothetical protein